MTAYRVCVALLLPPDWLDRFARNVEKVNLAQIREAFARRVDPARLVTVVVGAPD